MNFPIQVFDYEKENCSIGDVYRFTFKVKDKKYGIREFLAGEWIEAGSKFEIEDSFYDDIGNYIIQAKVIKNPLPFLAVFGIVVVGSSLMLTILGLQLLKVEKIVKVTAESILPYVVILFIGHSGVKLLYKKGG